MEQRVREGKKGKNEGREGQFEAWFKEKERKKEEERERERELLYWFSLKRGMMWFA